MRSNGRTINRCSTTIFLSRPIQTIGYANTGPKMRLEVHEEKAQVRLFTFIVGLD